MGKDLGFFKGPAPGSLAMLDLIFFLSLSFSSSFVFGMVTRVGSVGWGGLGSECD